MTKKNDRADRAGWKAHRLAQHREFLALGFSEKLERIEDMADFARSMLEARRGKGLPYRDPVSGERVPGVNESQAKYHRPDGERA